MNPGQVRFVGIQLDPHLFQVGDRINARTGLDVFTFAGMFLNHDPADRRIDRQVILGAGAGFNLLHLFRRQSP